MVFPLGLFGVGFSSEVVRTACVRFVSSDVLYSTLIFVSTVLFVTLADLFPLSHSEDEDAPSPLTVYVYPPSTSPGLHPPPSLLTTGNAASRRLHQQQYPLSCSYSLGALLESDRFDETYDDDLHNTG